MSTVFWDFDGTLVYSHHLWSGSMYAALTAVHPHTAVLFHQIRECNTRGFTWQTPERNHTHLIGDAWWHHIEAHAYSTYLSCGESEAVASAAAALVKGFIMSPDRYHLFPDTLAVLNECKRRGHRNVLLSNNYPELEMMAHTLGLTPYLDGVITSALEGYDKPRRELFEIAKTRFPDTNYYMIGDNPTADIHGGNNAGMTTVLVHTAPVPDADCCVAELTDSIQIIK